MAPEVGKGEAQCGRAARSSHTIPRGARGPLPATQTPQRSLERNSLCAGGTYLHTQKGVIFQKGR